MQRLKIAFVFPPIWSPHSDGSLQIWNREITRRLSKSSDVLVYSGKFDFKSSDLVEGISYRPISTRLDQIFISRLHRIYRALGLRRPPFSTDLWHAMYAVRIALDVRKQRCDVVHIYNYPQFAHVIRRLNPKPRIVLNMHGEWLTQIPFTKLHTKLRDPDLIISCSDLITRAISTRFPEIAGRCKTVPMGASLGVFSNGRNGSRQENASPRRLLYVGRLSPEKGVHDLIDAFELIYRQFPDATLTIVGPEWVAPREHIVDLCLGNEAISKLAQFYEGSYLSILKERVSKEASHRVRFVGLVDHKSISKYYAAADVYVSPSLYESFGMSIVEAMAAGIPVVAAAAGAVPDFVFDRRTGLLVETSNPSAIATAVSELFTNGTLRSSIIMDALHEVQTQFSWETICSNLMRLYCDDPATGVGDVGHAKCVSELKPWLKSGDVNSSDSLAQQ